MKGGHYGVVRLSKQIKLYKYLGKLKLGKLKLGKFDSYLSLTPKHVLTFFVVYSVLLLIFNLLFVLATRVPTEGVEFLLRFPFSLSFSLTPCTIAKAGSLCTIDFGVVLLYTCFATVSYLLVFNRKLKFGHWIIGFIFFNLLASIFLVLKDYLYLNL